ncbi:Na(+)/H(+) antiporter subunit B [Streptomyces sp. DT24]|uniref:Na(+)/H(+) antiporter subunit B n=1 Tax=Streptomyces sp. DT24 TaxID=3416520 RepID=UPI003CE81B92
MTDALTVIALLLVAASATTAVLVRDPARQALVLSVLGLTLAALFLVLQAPDVALSQLAVGSALTPLLLLLSVHKVRRRGKRPAPDGERPAEDRETPAPKGRRRDGGRREPT